MISQEIKFTTNDGTHTLSVSFDERHEYFEIIQSTVDGKYQRVKIESKKITLQEMEAFLEVLMNAKDFLYEVEAIDEDD